MPPIPGHPRLAKDATHVSGQTRIVGTRIAVDLIKRNVAAGMTMEGLLKVYTNLTREDVEAALAFEKKEVAE